MTVDNIPDLPEFYTCLETLSQHTKEFEGVVSKVKELYDSEGCDTGAGISLLELKNHTVLQYLINLLTLMLRKVEGKDIEDVRWDTIVNRVTVERIRPLEAKLQYQIEKLLRNTKNEALNYKPDVEELESSGDEEEEEEGGVYKAPRVAAVHYYEPEVRGKRAKKDDETAAPKLGRGVLEDLRKEMSSAPEEMSYANAEKQTKRARERKDYEESNFIRMNQTKADRKKPRLQSGLSSIMDFDDAEMFKSAEAERGGKKGKMGGKGKKGKKFKKFKRR